jgi:hypothetical protein
MPDISYYLEKRLPMAEAKRRVEEDVFGVGFRRDRSGRPVEQGIGSPGHETEQHYDALSRYEGQSAADVARAKAKARGGT